MDDGGGAVKGATPSLGPIRGATHIGVMREHTETDARTTLSKVGWWTDLPSTFLAGLLVHLFGLPGFVLFLLL